MKYLITIFCYNRPHLLKNAVESFIEFGPEGDLLVVDDGSNDPEVIDYLNMLENRKLTQVSIRRCKREYDRRLGGLYPNMEMATKYAKDNGYDYIFYSQDDQQFMWRDNNFWRRVNEIFEHHPNAFMVRPAFDKLIFSHNHANRFNICDSCPGLLFKKAGFSAVGILSINKINKYNWHFQPTEVTNEAVVLETGLEMYLMKTAIIAPVPVPETWRFGKRVGKTKAPINKYFLKPLSEKQIFDLENSVSVPLIEDYCFPWGWKRWSPYNHSTDRKKYFANLWRWFKKNRLRRWPKWQGVQ